MAKVKFDKEKADTLITDLTTLKSEIDSCLDDINGCGSWKNKRDSDMVVRETRQRTVTTVVDGISQSTIETYTVNTYPNDTKVDNYNGALSSIQQKATALKTTSRRISKVINALTKVKGFVDDFENTSGLTMAAELGDAADHNFNFLESYGDNSYGSLRGPNGYLGQLFDRIDISEFTRFGDTVITSADSDNLPENVIDYDEDGNISISDYLKSYVSTMVNEDGKVVIDGVEIGDFETVDLVTLATSGANLETLVGNVEKEIEEKLDIVVDITGTLAAIAVPKGEDDNVPKTESSEDERNLGQRVEELNRAENELRLNQYLANMSPEQRAEFEERAGEYSIEEQLEYIKNNPAYIGLLERNDKPIFSMEEKVPVGDEEATAESAGEAALVGSLAGLNQAAQQAGKNIEELATTAPTTTVPVQDTNGFQQAEASGTVEVTDPIAKPKTPNSSYEDKHYNDYDDGRHGRVPKGTEPATTPPSTQPPTQPSTQPQTTPATEPKTTPATTPKTEPDNHHRGDDHRFEVVEKGDDMPKLKDETPIINEEDDAKASSALLGAAGIGAGTVLSGGGNSTPAIPNVDLGVSAPVAPTPSTMTTPSNPSAPATTVQNNTPIANATPDMDDVVASNSTAQNSNNTTTYSTRTTADTSSEGISKGKYSNSGSGASTSTSKQSKDTLTKDGEFKDDKDDNNTQNKVDTSKPEGVLGEASYAELIAKEEKQIKVATAITASSMAVSIALSLASVIDVIVLVLLLLAMALAYSVFRKKKKKNIKKLEALIRIEKIKKEETEEVVKEEVENSSEEGTSENEQSSDEEEKTTEKENITETTSEEEKVEVSKVKEVEEIVSEKKEFQSAEEVIYGKMPEHNTEAEEKATEEETTK